MATVLLFVFVSMTTTLLYAPVILFESIKRSLLVDKMFIGVFTFVIVFEVIPPATVLSPKTYIAFFLLSESAFALMALIAEFFDAFIQ